MNDVTQDRRSPLLALKVPFDLSGLALGALTWVTLVMAARHGHGFGNQPWRLPFPKEIYRSADHWLVLLLGTRDRDPLEASPRMPWLDLVGDPSPWSVLSRAEFLLPLLVLLAAFIVFGVAACRVAALRLARDEGLSTTDALVFSLRNLGSSVGAVLFATAAIGLFLGLNAVAGLAGRVPLVGAIAFPLSLLGALVLFLLLLGTVLGLPLAFAGLATERNGALDAVSRSFSYVFGRPALFAVSAATVAFFSAILLAVASFLPRLALATAAAGAPEGDPAMGAFRAAVEAAVDFSMPDFGNAGIHAVTGWVTWLFAVAFRVAAAGWATYYVFGGATATYFALRHDVDGTEDEEIWIEGEEESLGEPESPEPLDAAGDGPPGPAAAPPPGGGS